MSAPLPLRTKLLYATSSLGGEALGKSRDLWLVYFYAPPADAELETLLPKLLVGLLLTVGKILEAFDDALIGWWSDRTNSRWGRRIPFILLATPPWALFGYLAFTPPDAGTAATALYFFVVLELFFLFATLSGGPYEALLPEIAPTSDDRVQLQMIKVYLGVVGGAIGLIGSDYLKDAFGFKTMALTIAAIALVSRYIGLAGVWRRASRSRVPAELGFREAMRAAFSNKSFLLFLPTFVLFQIGFLMLIGALPFYVDALLEEGSWLKVRILAAVAIAAAVAMVPLFALLARRTSKRHAYRVAMLGAAVAFPLMALAGAIPGIPTEAEILIAVALAGAPVGGNYLFPATLTADIIDDDSGRTGLRREATFYGAQNFVEKTASSFAPLFLVLLRLFGDTASNPLGIRLVGPVAGVIALGGYLIFRTYDLADDVAVRVAPAAAD
jgi:GPH family glycoside/pentoside/hexuronide:cation symporter